MLTVRVPTPARSSSEEGRASDDNQRLQFGLEDQGGPDSRLNVRGDIPAAVQVEVSAPFMPVRLGL